MLATSATTWARTLLILGVMCGVVAAEDDSRIDAVERCLQQIRSCQLSDGLIRLRVDGDAVQGVPYVANLAATALLAAHHIHPNSDDVDRVGRWLDWYAAHQNPDGTISRYSGTVPSYAATEKLDTPDLSASSYLLALEHYRKASDAPDFSERFGASADRTMEAVQSLVDPRDALTWASSENRHKYLMDNIVVSMCMLDAAELFDAIREPQRAFQARQVRRGILASLKRFRSNGADHFAWAISADGQLSTGLDLTHKQRANLHAVANVEVIPQGLWPQLRDSCSTESLVMTTRCYFAARRAGGDKDRARFRSIVLKQALSLEADDFDVFEPALAILVLLDSVAL